MLHLSGSIHFKYYTIQCSCQFPGIVKGRTIKTQGQPQIQRNKDVYTKLDYLNNSVPCWYQWSAIAQSHADGSFHFNSNVLFIQVKCIAELEYVTCVGGLSVNGHSWGQKAFNHWLSARDWSSTPLSDHVCLNHKRCYIFVDTLIFYWRNIQHVIWRSRAGYWLA